MSPIPMSQSPNPVTACNRLTLTPVPHERVAEDQDTLARSGYSDYSGDTLQLLS